MDTSLVNKKWCALDNQKWAEISLQHWFMQLRFKHSESTHSLILESLSWQEIELMVQTAADGEPDFEAFSGGVRQAARRARAAGLVLPDHDHRAAGAGRPATLDKSATLDMFGGVEK